MLGIILVALSAICFSTAGMWTVLMKGATDVNPLIIPFFRFFFSAIIGIIVITLSKGLKKPNKKELKATCFFGFVGNVSTNILYTMACFQISSGMVSMIHFGYPILAAVLSFLIYRIKPKKGVIVASVLMVVGLALISGGGALNFAGVALALATTVTFATYILASDHSAMKNVASFYIVTICSLMGASVLFVYLNIAGQFSLPGNPLFYLYAFLSSLISVFLAFTFLSEGIKKGVSSSISGFISIIEPAFALIWDVFIFGTALSQIELYGIGLIFISFIATIL